MNNMDLNTFTWLSLIGLFVSVTPYIFLYLYKRSHKKEMRRNQMIRKLLCWLGWHEYQRVEMIKYTNKGTDNEGNTIINVKPFYRKQCKHCKHIKDEI